MLECRGAGNHAALGVLQSPAVGESRFVVDGESLGEPGRTVGIGEQRGRSAKDVLREAPCAPHTVEVEDVGELVRDDDAKPVFIEAEGAGVNGRRGEDDDAVGGNGGGVAVGVVGVVGDYEVDGAARWCEFAGQQLVSMFGCGAGDAAFALEAVGHGDAEVPRVERAVVVVWGGLGAGRYGDHCGAYGCEERLHNGFGTGEEVVAGIRATATATNF